MGREKEVRNTDLWDHKSPLRAAICRKLLHRLEKHTPPFLDALQIQILLGTTARAFGVKPMMVWYLAPEKALQRYASFTLACMQKAEGEQRGAVLSQRLYRHALGLGSFLRRVTGFSRREDVDRLIFYLYRTIGIAMEGRIPGEITVTACCFSRYYSPWQCAMMSSMDAGVIGGICGGGRLRFTERITEGCGRCRACFVSREK